MTTHATEIGLDAKARRGQNREALLAPLAGRPPAEPKPLPPPTAKVSVAREAVRRFLLAECQAREVRITKVGPLPGGEGGWEAEAEILLPDLGIKMLGLPLTQEVLERQYCAVELDPALHVKSYEFLDEHDR